MGARQDLQNIESCNRRDGKSDSEAGNLVLHLSDFHRPLLPRAHFSCPFSQGCCFLFCRTFVPVPHKLARNLNGCQAQPKQRNSPRVVLPVVGKGVVLQDAGDGICTCEGSTGRTYTANEGMQNWSRIDGEVQRSMNAPQVDEKAHDAQSIGQVFHVLVRVRCDEFPQRLLNLELKHHEEDSKSEMKNLHGSNLKGFPFARRQVEEDQTCASGSHHRSVQGLDSNV
mmetsp:Transcript_46702/g.84286  ORF Transcript_46702/g.84286 Transcript_46702/m.84286 type:complete len:226 (+) Transcript_46702:974-1651(+)